MTRVETMWCTTCGARFTEEEIKSWGCPKCGDQGIPCGTDKDVTVEVNWHELHILCVWAENFAQSCAQKDPQTNKKMPSVITAIARRLQRQFPNLSQLTLSDEVAELPAALQKAGIECGPIETTIPRPEPIPVNGLGAVGHGRNDLRIALQKIADLVDSEVGEPLDDAIDIANKALGNKNG